MKSWNGKMRLPFPGSTYHAGARSVVMLVAGSGLKGDHEL